MRLIGFNSFFAGIGGFDAGFEEAGMQCRFQSELNPFRQEVLKKNFPNITRRGDIKEIMPDDLPKSELWCGGFPCQDLSLANQGKRKGLDGDRSGLFFEFHRLLEPHRPKWIVLENVPGLLTVTKGQISEFSSKSWMNSGMVFRGEYWTQNILEHPKDVEECLLSEVLETSSPLECFLNPVELISLINRAWARGKDLDPLLEKSLVLQLHSLSNTQESIANLAPDLKQKVIEMMAKHTRSTAGEVQMLFVRRMMVSEYEVLQGFPKNWTLID